MANALEKVTTMAIAPMMAKIDLACSNRVAPSMFAMFSPESAAASVAADGSADGSASDGPAVVAVLAGGG